VPRLPIIAGNWKMNTTPHQAVALVGEMLAELDEVRGVEKVLCPPFVSLGAIERLIQGTSIKLGAQNMYFEEKGAYTGEVSPPMLAELCQYVILGHSERRHHFGETDELINQKVKAALAFGLNPILCVGETLAENEAGRTVEVVTGQVRGCLAGIEWPQGLVIAYEPVWAIGTGRAASGPQANAIMGIIRDTVAQLYGQAFAEGLRIQYGGSVTSANIGEFIEQPHIDGALVGGASLQAAEFIDIVRQTATLKRG